MTLNLRVYDDLPGIKSGKETVHFFLLHLAKVVRSSNFINYKFIGNKVIFFDIFISKIFHRNGTLYSSTVELGK